MKEKLEEASSSGPSPPEASAPPTYSAVDPNPAQQPPQINEIPPDFSQQLQNLNLDPSPPKFASADLCIAHLKLLEAFHLLRSEIAGTDDIFGIASHASDDSNLNQLREKRWQVYVSRAVDRFEKWWDTCIPASKNGQPCEKLTCERLVYDVKVYDVFMEGMPGALDNEIGIIPLDILMVWHAYMLKYVQLLICHLRKPKLTVFQPSLLL